MLTHLQINALNMIQLLLEVLVLLQLSNVTLFYRFVHHEARNSELFLAQDEQMVVCAAINYHLFDIVEFLGKVNKLSSPFKALVPGLYLLFFGVVKLLFGLLAGEYRGLFSAV